jgi:hypothetical protein
MCDRVIYIVLTIEMKKKKKLSEILRETKIFLARNSQRNFSLQAWYK